VRNTWAAASKSLQKAELQYRTIAGMQYRDIALLR